MRFREVLCLTLVGILSAACAARQRALPACDPEELPASGGSSGNGVAADGQGGVLVVGDFKGSFASLSSEERSGFALRLDAAGRTRWLRNIGQSASCAVLLERGDALVCGIDQGAGFVARLDPDGEPRWQFKLPGTASRFRAAVADGAGGVWAIGGFTGSLGKLGASRGQQDVVLVHLSSEGTLLAWRTYGSEGGEQGRAVVVAGGSVVIAGEFGGALRTRPEIDFGLGPVRTNGDTDGFLASINNDFSGRWVRTFGARGNDEIQGLAAFDEDVVAVGHVQPDRDYGRENPHEVPTFQALIARHRADGSQLWQRVASGEQTVLAAIAVRGDHFFAAGHARGPAELAGAHLSAGAFLLTFDGAGNAVDILTCGSSEGRRYAYAVAATSSGPVVVGTRWVGERPTAFVWR